MISADGPIPLVELVETGDLDGLDHRGRRSSGHPLVELVETRPRLHGVRRWANYVVPMLWVLVIIALVLSGGSAYLSWQQARAGRRASEADDLPSDLLGLRQEVAALRREAAGSLRHLAVVRYDAFSDMGGHLSWSVALLDDGGSGVVLSSIHGRSDSRSYAKSIADWKCEHQLSPEETEAIEQARP